MEMQRSHHAVAMKPQRPLQVIRGAQGVRFAPQGAFVLCLHQGMGMQPALCRITPCSRTTASGLIIWSFIPRRMSSCWHLGTVFPQRVFWGNISVSSSIAQLREFGDALCQPYPVCDVRAFFVFFFPPSNRELNMKFREELTLITLTVVLICWDLSRFLKALNWHYWELRKSLRTDRADESAGMGSITLILTQVFKTKTAICLELNETVVTQNETLLPRLTPCFLKFLKDKTQLF